MSEQPPPDYTFLRYLVVTIAVFVLVFAFAPMISTWIACQQLAPVERAFVRGC